MSHPDIIQEEPITISELKKNLEVIQKRDEELSFRAGKTVDHLNHIESVDEKKRKELIQNLESLEVPRIKDFHIVKIVDLMPKTVKELNIILSGYTLTVNKEYQQKIIDTLSA